MMKIAIVTWVSFNNFGTQLQEFALQKLLISLGIHCDIISDYAVIRHKSVNTCADDKNKSSKDRMISNSYSFKDVLERIHILKKRIVQRIDWYLRQDFSLKDAFAESQSLFALFKNKRLNIKYVNCSRDYYSLNQKYDIFICGSDQIWSPLEHNFNGYYFLDFVSKIKIAYATSMGTYYIPDDKKLIIQKYLADFRAISVREKSTADLLSGLLGKAVEWVADPTLLWDYSFWNQYTQVPCIKFKFLLCYFLENQEWYFDYAERLAQHLGLRPILIPSRKDFLTRKECFSKGVGPEEFLGMVSCAAYVLTDSYHGSIFSLIFKKNFLYLKRFNDDETYNQNIRIDSLFRYLDIYDNVVVCKKAFRSGDVLQLEHEKLEQKILAMREKSILFLKNYCLAQK